ncbi:hypothetical protein LR48_Vigan05g202300 [Vigna angularis]|uniref:Protein kinase domain-containing protein n=1 Tax=Phaseolus angularis TaxID=3914 RepID=A0A0L9UNU6_PHAAN|nr:U-box domain-containing protein 35 [Vigna angularis]KOM44418.1 hypothetical protein LR48_Vigan05g202300 [Vigna angularis]
MGSNAAEEESTLIAIDSDQNSQHAVKWAVEYLFRNNSSCTLLHVRTKNLYHNDLEVFPKQGRPPTEEELQQIFLPFRGFCARKRVAVKELVLQDTDVVNALTNYIILNSINNVVVGASRSNALLRKFKDVDVPTSLLRSVPQSCMMHIISKRKVQNIRPAGHSHQNISIAPSKSLKAIRESFRSKDLNRRSLQIKFWQSSNNDGVSPITPHKNNGETDSTKLSDETSSLQTSSNQSFLKEDTSRLFDHQTSETSHGKQNVVINSNCRSKSSKKPPTTKHENIRQEEGDMHEEEERNKPSNEIAPNKVLFKRYNIREIEIATNYFNNALKIGEGSYGPVFKGVLDNIVVAVKALRPDITHGEKQFQQEVSVLSTIRHSNMVKLLGACPEYGCLVYEYMENGSLEDRLFQKDNTPAIPWKVRFKIASEIATGLLFLHQTKPEPIVHRDLKPANILLDCNYGSKITDVGLARLVPPAIPDKTTQYHKTTAAGTFCYIDPEYQQTGLLGVKSDIYSLGVVLLQIITGKPPMGVAHFVQEGIEKGTFSEVLDPNVMDWPVEDTLSFAKLALKCCEMRKRDRPDLASVILPELSRLTNLGVVITFPKDKIMV